MSFETMVVAMGHSCWPDFVEFMPALGLDESDSWGDIGPWFECFAAGWNCARDARI